MCFITCSLLCMGWCDADACGWFCVNGRGDTCSKEGMHYHLYASGDINQCASSLVLCCAWVDVMKMHAVGSVWMVEGICAVGRTYATTCMHLVILTNVLHHLFSVMHGLMWWTWILLVLCEGQNGCTCWEEHVTLLCACSRRVVIKLFIFSGVMCEFFCWIE